MATDTDTSRLADAHREETPPAPRIDPRCLADDLTKARATVSRLEAIKSELVRELETLPTWLSGPQRDQAQSGARAGYASRIETELRELDALRQTARSQIRHYDRDGVIRRSRLHVDETTSAAEAAAQLRVLELESDDGLVERLRDILGERPITERLLASARLVSLEARRRSTGVQTRVASLLSSIELPEEMARPDRHLRETIRLADFADIDGKEMITGVIDSVRRLTLLRRKD